MVHVDLSVLVWFVALAGLLWSLGASAAAPGAGAACWPLCGGRRGALMALAPFLGSRQPIMANYIPVLDGARCFRSGLVGV